MFQQRLADFIYRDEFHIARLRRFLAALQPFLGFPNRENCDCLVLDTTYRGDIQSA